MKEERALGIKPEKESNIKGQRTVSPRAPAKDAAEEEGAGAQSAAHRPEPAGNRGTRDRVATEAKSIRKGY